MDSNGDNTARITCLMQDTLPASKNLCSLTKIKAHKITFSSHVFGGTTQNDVKPETHCSSGNLAGTTQREYKNMENK
jgi:hypothetical protein